MSERMMKKMVERKKGKESFKSGGSLVYIEMRFGGLEAWNEAWGS